MKDYNLFLDLNGKDEIRKKYILRYEIKEDASDYKKNIIIYFADGKEYSLPYTVENEKQILKKMRQQFNDYKLDMLLWKKGKNFNVSFVSGLVKISTFMLSIGILAIVLFAHSLALGIGLTFGIIGLVGSLISWPLKIIANRQMKDFEKHMLFFENEEKINQALKQNDNILANVSSDIKNKTTTNEERKKVCTINSIDKMTLKELRELLNAIKREESIFQDEEKGKGLVKKIKDVL